MEMEMEKAFYYAIEHSQKPSDVDGLKVDTLQPV